MMKKLLSLSLPLVIAVLSCPATLSASWGSRPSVKVTVGGGSTTARVAVGTTLSISGQATDADGNLLEHWLEIKKPRGGWSWEGWLKKEPWLGALVGTKTSSKKSGTFTFNEVGTYVVRSTANDTTAPDQWVISNLVHVTVTAASTPPPKDPPVQGAPDDPEEPTDPVEPNEPNEPEPAPTPVPSPGAGGIFNTDGSVNRAAYVEQLAVWTRESVSRKLGPTFEQLNPNATDTRPTHFMPSPKVCKTSYVNKVNPYELGPAKGCYPDNDYWSETGQVAYVPVDTANDPGLDRIQTFAYYDHVFAISPRLDWTGAPHPDPQTRDSNYRSMLGGDIARFPVAMVRNYGMLQNEALILYRDGLLAVAGTQTSREWWERPYPGILFPDHKVPTSIAVTTGNEFALITIWDTQALKGQLAVVALEAKWLPFHTWPYMGLPNQGSWSDFKLLGYIDLPMAAPSAVAAASNGWWDGPSQTAGRVLSQIDLSSASTRANMTGNSILWTMLIANKGYAVVASKDDHKAVIVDLEPLFAYVRNSYLSSTAAYWQTLTDRAAGRWPATFAQRPEIKPRVVWEQTLTSPTAVLAGLRLDRWSPDRHKAYVAQQDGTIQIIDTSSLMKRWDWEKSGALAQIGSVKVGRNPVNMVFARHAGSNLPLLPTQASGKAFRADPLNNQFYVACRGDREIAAVITYEGQGQVYRRIQDRRMGDPVALNVTSRGNILTVCDFNGKKMLSFRIGGMTDRHGRYYGAGADGKAPFEFAGEHGFEGYPLAISTSNVN